MKFSPAYSPSIPGHLRIQKSVRSLDIPARLVIDASEPVTGFHFQPEGDFPRRVTQGEPIASINGLNLISPMSGIVHYEDYLYTIKVGGSLRIGQSEKPESVTSIDQLCDRLDEGGVVSLDYPGNSISTILKSEPEIIVFSALEPDGSIDWNQTGLLEKLDELKSIFQNLGFQVHTVGLDQKSQPLLAANRQIPNLCSKIKDGLHPGKPVIEQGIGYFGPATIHAMLDLLFDNLPFFRRPIAFHSHQKSYLAVVPNGSHLSSIVEIPQESSWIAGPYFSQDSAISFSANDKLGVSIYNTSAYYEQFELDSTVMPCSLCMACQKICPVDASVLSLVAGNPENFAKKDCFECGLCQYACESNIPLLDEIRRAG